MKLRVVGRDHMTLRVVGRDNMISMIFAGPYVIKWIRI